METDPAEPDVGDAPFDLQAMDAVIANRAACERVEQRHSEAGTFTSWLNRLASWRPE